MGTGAGKFVIGWAASEEDLLRKAWKMDEALWEVVRGHAKKGFISEWQFLGQIFFQAFGG